MLLNSQKGETRYRTLICPDYRQHLGGTPTNQLLIRLSSLVSLVYQYLPSQGVLSSRSRVYRGEPEWMQNLECVTPS